MSILKYKDPITGEFKRINPYKADLSFVGKDGIVVNKDPNSEEVEISGSGCVQKTNTSYVLYGTTTGGAQFNRSFADNPTVNAIAQYSNTGILRTNSPIKDNDCTNKKYVADNYVEKVKFTNLEQALNGYILDTTKEAYADLDSAVLKDSVSVGDNVYPIADKTRALVTRIEGKTTKMVQLLDKSTFPATLTPSAGVTVTKTDDGGLHVLGTAASSGGRNSWGITVNVKKGHKYLNLLKGNNKLTAPFVTLKSDRTQYLSIADIATSTIEGECSYGFNLATEDYDETIYPNLFDLTAMNREDITTVEQFKAEFPELYPYENGNIYPAKISGVKFYENQDKSGEQASVTLPETYDLHGIGDYKDYLEITKNEDNELYTLKKVQSVEVDESEKTITPLETPVETVIATNLTYEQVTAIRHNGGLIEAEGNTNKGYARPTIKNTIVYRLTATNAAEG